MIDIEDELNINELTKIINKTTLKYNIDPLKISIISTVDNDESLNNPIREGVVFKSCQKINGEIISFKAISKTSSTLKWRLSKL
jgi:hypothetical protein